MRRPISTRSRRQRSPVAMATPLGCQKLTHAPQQTTYAECSALLDHLIGPEQKLAVDAEPQHLSGCEINDHLEVGRLYHWQVGGFFALEDAAHLETALTGCIRA